jgi:hypothetical protein
MLPTRAQYTLRQTTFSHPDYTVGSGIAPDQPIKGSRAWNNPYRRYGISPVPEGFFILFYVNYSNMLKPCQYSLPGKKIVIIWTTSLLFDKITV